jgi:hypothetical protein
LRVEKIDELCHTLSLAPPGHHAQIDESITPKFKELIGKSTSDQVTGLKSILDDCAHGALASGFAMVAMDTTWKMAQEDERKEVANRS